jgi:hypothetical protein
VPEIAIVENMLPLEGAEFLESEYFLAIIQSGSQGKGIRVVETRRA